jgi:hypothetical protein
MKVPILRGGQNTQPSSEKRGFLSGNTIPGAFGVGVGEALQGLGRSISGMFDSIIERNEKSSRYKTATSFSVFQQEMGEKLGELRRTTDPAKVNYAQSAEDLFDNNAANFLNTRVPADQRDEYALRIQQYKTGIIGNSLTFQYKAQDAYFRQSLADEWNKSMVTVRNDPTTYEGEAERLGTLILESDLPEIDKRTLAREFRFSLLGATYKGDVAQGNIQPSAIGIGSSDLDDYYASVKVAESGGNPNAKSKTASASGLYGFTDGTWKKVMQAHPEAGLTLAGKNNPAQQEIAIRLLTADNEKVLRANGVPVNNQTRYMAHFLGPGLVDNVMASSDDTPMRNIVPPGYLRANAFLRSMDVADFKAWAAKKGGGADARFADIPYEDREALYNDANADLRRQNAVEAASSKALYDQRIEAMEQGIIAGTFGYTQLNDQFAEGNIQAADYWRMEGRIEKQNGPIQAMQRLVDADSQSEFVDFNDSEMKDAADALYNLGSGTSESGSQRIRNRDQDYANAMLGIAGRTDMISPAYATDLSGMLASTEPANAIFGARNISALAAAKPASAKARFSGDALRKADLINSVGEVLGEEKALEFAAAYNDPDRIRNRQLMIDEAERVLTQYRKDDGFEKAFDAAGVGYGSTNARASAQLWREYETAFKVGFAETGSEEAAQKFAEKQLQRDWAEVTFSGNTYVMKNPPTKYWGVRDYTVDEMVRAQSGMSSDDQYQLIGDRQTREEIARGVPPSYAVVDYETGAMVLDGTGRPRRISKKMDETMKLRQTKNRSISDQEDRVAQTYHAEVRPLEVQISQIQGNEGEDSPKLPELYEELAAAREKYDQEVSTLQELKPPIETDVIPKAVEVEKVISKEMQKSPDIELPPDLDEQFKTVFSSTNIPDFVTNRIYGEEPDFVLVQRLTKNGPMRTLLREDPGLAKDKLAQFKEISGFGETWNTMPVTLKAALYDALYAEREYFGAGKLPPEFDAFVTDPEPNLSAYMKLQKKIDVRTQPENFMRAILQRSALRSLERTY